MKRLVFFIVCLIPLLLYGQKNQLEDKAKESLELYIKVLKKYQDDGIIKDLDYFKNLYVCTDNYPPYFNFSNTISGISINYISLNNYLAYEKILKQGIWIIILNSLILEKNNLKISFDIKKATLKKKNHLYLGLSEWATFIFEYSCNEQKWILINEKYSGV